MEAISEAIIQTSERGLIYRLSGVPIKIDEGWSLLASVGLLICVVWLVWGGVFYRSSSPEPEVEGVTRRWFKHLVRGSVLELLVALPTHLAVRGKDECCAPAVSFIGIVTGLSVMLLCFGPGILFLYLERARRLRARQVAPAGK